MTSKRISERRVMQQSATEIIANSFKNNIRQYTMIIALFVIWIIFAFATRNFVFLSVRNLSNLFIQTATVGIMSFGVVLIIVSGHIDLSIGAVLGFIGAMAASLQENNEMSAAGVILISLLAGAVVGCWQGFWIAYRSVPAFIVTLSTMLICRGIALWITQGAALTVDSAYKIIGQKYLCQLGMFKNDSTVFLAAVLICLFVFFEIRRRASKIKYGFEVLPTNLQVLRIIGGSVIIAAVMFILIAHMGISYSLIIVLVLAAFFYFLAHNTTFGRQIYAIGGNEEASRLSGINIQWRLMALYIIMGLLCSVAATVYTSRNGGATAAAGNMMELDVIAAAVIGGTSFSGGVGTVLGALVGALVMTSLDNGMGMLSMAEEHKYIVKGAILLAAVWIDIVSRRNK